MPRLSPFAILGLAFLFPAPAAPGVQAITRESVDSAGHEAHGYSTLWRTPLSADNRYLAFESFASDLVANDTNGCEDVFVRDRVGGATVRVSVDSAGHEGNFDSRSAAISADGRYVAFESLASNLVANDGNHAIDAFVHDRDPDGNGIFDEGNGVTTRVSVDSSGVEGNAFSTLPSISGDGRYVTFGSLADNLVANDLNHSNDAFVHDRATGTTIRVSVDSNGVEGDQGAGFPAFSADGSVVAFESDSTNLVPGDTNNVTDIYVHVLATGVTERVSVDSAGAGGDWVCSGPVGVSADGAIIAFTSFGPLEAGDTNQRDDVYVRDRVHGTTERVSLANDGTQANDGCNYPSISADGAFVAFTSAATNLVANDDNRTYDAFLRDRARGRTFAISADCAGVTANGWSWLPELSADGTLVAFPSGADNLVPGDGNATFDVFIHDLSQDTVAHWDNYGQGHPGTNGTIPALTAQRDPILGTTLALDVGNSSGVASPALLFVGLASANVPTGLGGTLLVDILFTLPLALPSGGLTLAGDLPADPALCGFELFLQTIEHDAGASKQVSFSAGLELLLGE